MRKGKFTGIGIEGSVHSSQELPVEGSTTDGTRETGGGLGTTASVIFTVVVLLVSAWALYEAFSFPHLGAIFPVAATAPAILMAAALLIFELRAWGPSPANETRKKTRLAIGYFVAFSFYFFLIWLLGFGIATTLFTFVFLYGWAGMRVLHALIYTGCLVSWTVFMGWLLELHWPDGVLGM
jgi:hypothetical protein